MKIVNDSHACQCDGAVIVIDQRTGLHAMVHPEAPRVEFVRAVKARRAFALHDGLLDDVGRALTTRLTLQLPGADNACLQPGAAA
jgi:hypothetical protein